MFFCSHFILKIIERGESNSEITKVVNLGKCNGFPSPGKLIRFGKKIKKGSRNNQVYNHRQERGIQWIDKNMYNFDSNEEKWGYKYSSAYNREYNLSGYQQDEIVILAKPHKNTVYVFLEKHTQTIFYGVTNSSFTFKANKTICVYTKEIDYVSEIPLFIHICFVNGSVNVNKYRSDFSKSPLKSVILAFPAETFSSKMKLGEINSGVFGQPSYKFPEMIFPFSGLKKKELLRKWMNFKNGIPNDRGVINVNNSSIINNPSGYESDIEPLHLRRERLRRNRRIEAAIDAANFDYSQGSLSLEQLPVPDENGYISFSGIDQPTYDIENPKAMFRGYKDNDDGSVSYFVINGKHLLFNPDIECKVENGQFAFYYCPTNETFGIRYKKEVKNRESSNSDQTNSDNNDNNNTDVPAPMVNKYIYLDVLNPGINPSEMRPAVVDFYTKSYYHLGRLNYHEGMIHRKDQVFISKNELEVIWENREIQSNN